MTEISPCCLFVRLRTSLPACLLALPANLPVCPSVVCRSVGLSLSVCRSVCLSSVGRFVCLPVCLSVCLCVCLSVFETHPRIKMQGVTCNGLDSRLCLRIRNSRGAA